MTQYKKFISRTAIVFGSLLLPLVSFAQIKNPLNGISSIPGFVSSVLGIVVRIGAVVAIFAFIYSGYKFVAARGNQKELEEARTIFVSTCIGVAILLGAQLIASLVVSTINSIR